jgi:protoporphyrinogen/coproporphyrinogen III oxidase
MSRVVIVGGGISGLALAYRLEQLAPSAEVTVLERCDRVGGTVGTIERDGFRVEMGPNGFLDNNPSTLILCRDLGLGDRLVPASESARRNRFLFLKGRLRKLPTGLLSFLSSGVLSWRGKLALLTERFRRPLPDLADESIAAFARRRTNDEVADTLVDAFVTGIHAGDPALLSFPAAFPRLAELEREHGSLSRGMAAAAKQRRAEAKARGETPRRGLRTWSFREGLGLLIDSLRQRLHRLPVSGVVVRRVERDANSSSWRVMGEGQDHWQADAVVLACPAYQQASILADLDAELADRIGGIIYNRVAVVALGYRREEVKHPLDGFGYLSPGRERRDVLGVQWCSSIFEGRAPQGHVLLRAMCGGWHRAEMVDWNDERLLSAVRGELRQALGITAAPVFHQVVRWDRAIPQYHLGHLDRVAWIEQRVRNHAGLFLGGNCYRGISLNDCVEQAGLLAAAVARHIEARDVMPSTWHGTAPGAAGET